MNNKYNEHCSWYIKDNMNNMNKKSNEEYINKLQKEVPQELLSKWLEKNEEKQVNNSLLYELEKYQIDYNKNINASEYQYGMIPVYNILNLDLDDNDIKKSIYDNFYRGSGVLIVRGAYNNNIMDEYNKWCEEGLEIAKNDANFIHPKQKDKITINNVIERMSSNNPDLLINLLMNKYMNKFIDLLLGFSKFGSCTTHWIQPGGDRQLSHVDYPIHIGSGPFWENSVNKLKSLITDYQLNNILPYYSVQLLIASEDMSIKNGPPA